MRAVILVVDDDRSVRKSLLRLLTARGYQPIGAASGAGAIRQAARQRPDVILMDLHMPRMSGVDATRAIKENPRLEDVPVIAMSATAPPPGEIESLFESILIKPAPAAALFTAIDNALRT